MPEVNLTCYFDFLGKRVVLTLFTITLFTMHLFFGRSEGKNGRQVWFGQADVLKAVLQTDFRVSYGECPYDLRLSVTL